MVSVALDLDAIAHRVASDHGGIANGHPSRPDRTPHPVAAGGQDPNTKHRASTSAKGRGSTKSTDPRVISDKETTISPQPSWSPGSSRISPKSKRYDEY